jgi:hypothetical protein
MEPFFVKGESDEPRALRDMLDFPFANDTLGGSEMAHRRLLIDSRQKVNRIG